MTIAIIVACKDSFYIITDTLTSSAQGYYTLNNQKVFWSDQHKIGLCIAGQANLISKNMDRDSINVSHIVREFFVHIDTVDVSAFRIDNLRSILESYVDEQYSDYHNYFRFQGPGIHADNEVSYFYGGFRAEAGGQIETVIYSHHQKQDLTSGYNGATPYFANSDAVSCYINKALANQPVDISDQEALICLLDTHKDFTFKTCVPQASMHLNLDAKKLDGVHAYIGHDLHRIIFTNTDVTHNYIQYSGNDLDSIKVDENTPAIHYTAYLSEHEAIQAQDQAFDLRTGKPLPVGTLFVANPPQVAHQVVVSPTQVMNPLSSDNGNAYVATQDVVDSMGNDSSTQSGDD